MHVSYTYRFNDRVENATNDSAKITALCMLASFYDLGVKGLPQDSKMAHKLWVQASELGPSKDAHYHLSQSYGKYNKERGVEKDEAKEVFHMEEAAMIGDAAARCELGRYEHSRGRYDRAKKHMIVSAESGCDSCMEKLKRGKKKGVVTKEEYKRTLRAHNQSRISTGGIHRDISTMIYKNLAIGPGGVSKVYK